MRRYLTSILAIVLTTATVACARPSAHVPLVLDEADPAVTLANEKAGETSAYREGFLGEGDDRIHYVEAGSGPTIVFIHGFPAFWYIWFDQMEALRNCRRVIAIDAPGANLSAKPTEREYYRIANLANRLDWVIAELAPAEKITLVGHDWGGALAWSYAERDASRLAQLVVFSAPPQDLLMELLASDPEQRARSTYMERFSSISLDDIRADNLHESLFEIGYREMIRRGVLDAGEGEVIRRAIADPLAVHAGMEWYRANIPPFSEIDPAVHSWPSRGATANVPTLLIRGSKDRTFVPEMGERARSHARELTVRTIDNVGHWTPFENPAEANRLLFEFLEIEADCAARQ